MAKEFGLIRQNVKAVQAFLPPKCKKDLERFLGSSGWCSKFVKGYATVAEPLNNLRRKSVTWNWSEKCQSAFHALEGSIAKNIVLAVPHFAI